MSIKQAEEIVNNFVTSANCEVLSIQGRWGVGKTYFWNKIVKSTSPTIAHKKYAYVSLFGVNSLEALKNSLVINQIQSHSIGKTANQSASQLGKGLKAIFGEVLTKNEKLSDYTSGWLGELAFRLVNDSLICFDDLERSGKDLQITDVFGLASLLKEQHHCDVVFILNDDALKDRPDFESHHEKVIDYTIVFKPEAAESFDLVFSAAEPNYELLKRAASALNVTNIRILRKVKRFLSALDGVLFDMLLEIQETVAISIFLFTVAKFDNDRKFKDFLTTEFLATFQSIGVYLREHVKKESVSAEEKELAQLLETLGFQSAEELETCVFRFVELGYVEELLVSAAEKRNEAAQVGAGLRQYHAAWELYSTRFDDNEPEFIAALEKQFLAGCHYLSFENLTHSVSVLRQLGHERVADRFVDEYTRINVDAFQNRRTLHLFLSRATDPYLVEKMKAFESSDIVELSIAALSDKILSGNYLTDAEWEFLVKQEISAYEEFVRKEFDYYQIDAILKLPNLPIATSIQIEIAEKMKATLQMIAATSSINKVRIKDFFGLDPV